MDRECFAGVMSGTSLDGVDAVIADFAPEGGKPCHTLGAAHIGFPTMLRDELLALQLPGKNELARAASAANMLAELYADAIARALTEAKVTRDDVKAAGVHGQTLRHRPDLGITVQLNNAARVAEKAGMMRRRRFPEPRRRGRRAGRAAGAGVPRGTVCASRSPSRRRQRRRHCEHDGPAARTARCAASIPDRATCCPIFGARAIAA